MDIKIRVAIFTQIFKGFIPIDATNEQIERAYLELLPEFIEGKEEDFMFKVAQRIIKNKGLDKN